MQESFWNFFNQFSWEMSFTQTIIAILILAFSFLLRKLFSRLIVHGLYRLFSSKGEQAVSKAFLDTFTPPLGLVFIIGGFYAVGSFVDLPGKMENFFLNAGSTLTTFSIFWTVYRAIGNFGFLVQKSYKSVTDELYHFIATVLKIFVAALGFLSILESCSQKKSISTASAPLNDFRSYSLRTSQRLSMSPAQKKVAVSAGLLAPHQRLITPSRSYQPVAKV